MRFAHFSDIHVSAADSVWRSRDWLNKRMSAWINLRLLGRDKHFRFTDRIVAALVTEWKERNFDRVVFSGDATAMGFEQEVRKAAELLGVGSKEELPGMAVPGNHDYCTRAAMRSGCFEHSFASWQIGERVSDAVYPFAQRLGSAWLVAVNSATANRLAWDASGRVGADQLARLEKLLDRLEAGPRILVTHYPIWLANGKPERSYHGLRDLADLVSVAHRGGVVLWLHGHRHDAYHHPPSEFAPFLVLCAGSATQHGLWSYSDCTLAGRRLRVAQRVYDDRGGGFRDGRMFELELPAN